MSNTIYTLWSPAFTATSMLLFLIFTVLERRLTIMPAKWTKMTIKIRTDHHAMINTLAKMKRKRPYEILEEIIDFYIKHNDNIKKYISM